MRWTGPVDSRQADCMFAVRRALCAYHFWECDASLPDEVLPLIRAPAGLDKGPTPVRCRHCAKRDPEAVPPPHAAAGPD